MKPFELSRLHEACEDWEQGVLGPEETKELFQRLLDTGLVWQLDQHYGVEAVNMITTGAIVDTRERKR